MSAPLQVQKYRWASNSGKGYVMLPGLDGPGAAHFFGTRLLAEGDAPIPWDDLGGEREWARSRQVHGDRIIRAPDGAPKGGEPPAADALITNQPGVLLTVYTADCVPILFFDPARKAIAAIHAGWRGTLLRIAAKTAQEMAGQMGSDPQLLVAAIGPAIGPCCYEVGTEVWKEFKTQFSYGAEGISNQSGEKARLDLPRLNQLQLIEAGLRPENIFFSGLCTSCFPNLFYSFRRDGKKIGNMISGLLLTGV